VGQCFRRHQLKLFACRPVLRGPTLLSTPANILRFRNFPPTTTLELLDTGRRALFPVRLFNLDAANSQCHLLAARPRLKQFTFADGPVYYAQEGHSCLQEDKLRKVQYMLQDWRLDEIAAELPCRASFRFSRRVGLYAEITSGIS